MEESPEYIPIKENGITYNIALPEIRTCSKCGGAVQVATRQAENKSEYRICCRGCHTQFKPSEWFNLAPLTCMLWASTLTQGEYEELKKELVEFKFPDTLPDHPKRMHKRAKCVIIKID